MKVKILENVTIGGAIHKKDSTPELEAKHAKTLIEGDFAEEHTGEETADKPSPLFTDDELKEEFGALTKPELGRTIATAKKVEEGEPEFAQAQQVLAYCQKLISAE